MPTSGFPSTSAPPPRCRESRSSSKHRPRWPAAAAWEKLGGDIDVARRRVRRLHPFDQQVCSETPHVRVVAPDDGDRRSIELGQNDVVAADEREITRQLDASLAQRSDCSRHHLVRADDDRRRAVFAVEELGDGAVAGLGGECTGLDDAIRPGKVSQRELGLEPGPTLTRGSNRGAEDEVDATMPEIEEMPDGRADAALVVVEDATDAQGGCDMAIHDDARDIELR